MANNFSKFDIEPGCEERTPDFVPTHNERVDALSDEEREELYRRDVAADLWAIFSSPMLKPSIPVSDEILS